MIERYFTTELEKPCRFGNLFSKDPQTPEDLFDWKRVDVSIKDANGNPIFEQKDCEFPEDFSQTACDIIASKYFYRAENEYSLFDVVDRMCAFWKAALIEEGILTRDEADIFDDEIRYIIYNQMWAPNSPQWFNTGIGQAYGVRGDNDDLFYFDESENAVKPSPDRYTKTQASACFILDIKDKLLGDGSITDHYVTETKLFKGGSGVGTNFSPLRAEGEHLSSGGTSSGLMSYLKGLDVNAGTIKSGGTTRRAAKMVIVDIDHPEIESFIDWKVKEEEKAKALMRAGYDGAIGGEAYSTVAGQNSNNTVRVDDAFMKGLSDPEHFTQLKGRVDSGVDKYVNSQELFTKIAKAAWECGDPGIQFEDTINWWNTCKNSGRINASNPCGEFVFLDNTACNLSSINLEKFVSDREFDLNGFYHAVRLAQLAMEASIYAGHYPTVEVAENSYKFRPTGLGITGLAGFLEALNLSYDSKEARVWASGICSFMTASSYEISGEMAEKAGAFEAWRENKDCMQEVFIHHIDHLKALDKTAGSQDLTLLLDRSLKRWLKASEFYSNDIGYRNAQVTCIAPTGTISFAMDSSSTGIEPYFSRTVSKKLADGSVITQTNEAIKTADEIDPIDHVRMMAAIQPHISGAISKTVNLPNNATVDDIEEIYKSAHSLGCKSITVYRDGSKGNQVLNAKEKNSKRELEPIVERECNAVEKVLSTRELKREKPNGIRNSRTHTARIGGIKLYVTIGFYDDGKIAEIFVNTDRQGEVVNGLLDSLSKTISHLIQYGVEPKCISKILRGQKYEPAGFVEGHPNIKFCDSISDFLSRVIDLETGDYARIQVKPETITGTEIDELTDRILSENKESNEREEEKVYGEVCSVCGSSNIVRTGACKTCTCCGTTTGCG